ITINRHPELVSGSVPPFIRGSTRLPYCIFVILVRGKYGMQKKARQVLEGPAEGGLRNKVEQWNPASATHGKCPAAKKQMDSKAKRRHTKNTGINFGLRSQVNTSDKPAVSRNRKLNSLRSFRSNACFQPYLPSAAPKIDSQLFGIVSKEKVSTCKFTSIIVEYIQRTFRKNLPTFLL
ncbi:MAG: hypothetical protein II507_14220, partial [Treponema sp.]|nr:hypothetical protein [Treponema sp.]